MKIRYIDDRTTANILKKRTYFEEVKDEMFDGYIGVVDVIKVDHDWVVPRPGRENEKILGDGYKFLRILPKNKHFAILAMFDENTSYVELYIDIINSVGVDKTNTPYMEDLYLDIVVTRYNEIIILDEDELEKALRNNEITNEHYNIALNEKEELLKFLDEANIEKIKKYSKDKLLELYKKLK